MKVKTVGYYKEMPHGGKSSISIKDFIKKEDEYRIDKICNYLDSGIEFVVSPGFVDDVIDSNKGIAGGTSTYTDGEWFWPGDLSYYVKNYRLKLPEEFIKTMEKNEWKIIKTIDDLDYSDLEIDGVKVDF